MRSFFTHILFIFLSFSASAQTRIGEPLSTTDFGGAYLISGTTQAWILDEHNRRARIWDYKSNQIIQNISLKSLPVGYWKTFQVLNDGSLAVITSAQKDYYSILKPNGENIRYRLSLSAQYSSSIKMICLEGGKKIVGVTTLGSYVHSLEGDKLEISKKDKSVTFHDGPDKVIPVGNKSFIIKDSNYRNPKVSAYTLDTETNEIHLNKTLSVDNWHAINSQENNIMLYNPNKNLLNIYNLTTFDLQQSITYKFTSPNSFIAGFSTKKKLMYEVSSNVIKSIYTQNGEVLKTYNLEFDIDSYDFNDYGILAYSKKDQVCFYIDFEDNTFDIGETIAKKEQEKLAEKLAAVLFEKQESLDQVNKTPAPTPASNSKQAETYFNNGSKNFGEGNYKTALIDFNKVINDTPDHFPSHLMLSFSYIMDKQPQKAIEAGKNAFKYQGFDIMGAVVLTMAYISAGDEGNAQKYALEAIAQNVGEVYDPKNDLQSLKDKGYNAALCDRINDFIAIRSLNQEQTKRDNAYKAFQAAQKITDHKGKIAEYKNVLQLEQSLMVPRNAVMGGIYADLGQLYNIKGDYLSALSYHEKGLPYLERFQDKPILIQAYTNAAKAYLETSQTDLALQICQKAIEIGINLPKEYQADLAKAYATKGNIQASIKELRLAQGYYEKAYDLVKNTKNKAAIASISNNIGTLYGERGDYNQSLSYFKTSLNIFREIKDNYSEAFTLSNIAEIALRSGDSKNALEYYRSSDKIFEGLGETYQRGRIGKEIGELLMLQGLYNDAIPNFERAISHLKSNTQSTILAASYSGLANCYFMTKNNSKANEYISKAVDINQSVLKNADEATKRGLIEKQYALYQLRTLIAFNTGDYKQAFAYKEESRSTILRNKLGGQAIRADEIPALIGQDAALIDYNVLYQPENYPESYFFPIVLTSTKTTGTSFTDSGIKEYAKTKLREEVKKLRDNSSGLRSYSSASRSGISTSDPSIKLQNELEYVIELYRELLQKNEPTEDAMRRELANILYNHFIGPLESLISGKNELYILPDGVLAFVPFETLIDNNGKYLCSRFTIRYVQSASILKTLKNRNYSSSRKPLVAFANPVFENVDPNEVMQYPKTDFGGIQSHFEQAINQSRSMRPAYISLGVTKWNPLPGTKQEVEQISQIVKGAEIHTQNEASESYFKKFNADGKFNDYKVIHFATHGFSFAAIPGMSAVILSQYKNGQTEDGYLQVHEAESLNLKADLVTISACETGLGKSFRGEGVLGLTQSFMIAGANGMAVSLWAVSDAGTAKFMTEVYNRVYNQGDTFPNAFTKTKNDFISGKYGASFAHPGIWAPFVYYGK